MPVRFEDCFWSSENPQDYRSGVTILNDKMAQGSVECDEIITFLNARIAIEEQYASRLIDLANSKLSPYGFGRDEGASLRRTFESLRQECADLGKSHRQMGGNISEMVLKPLARYAEEHRRKLKQGKEDVDAGLKFHERQVYDLDRAHAYYQSKCMQADTAEDAAMDRPLSLTLGPDGLPKPAMLGPITFPSFPELDEFLARMQSQLPFQDVPSLFGTYKDAVSGEALADWLCAARPDVCEDNRAAEAVGQAMLSQGFLKPIRRISVFRAEAAQMFQWKKSENEALALAHKKARGEAESADAAYRSLVRRAENSRMLMEQNLVSHLQMAEAAEAERIETIKASFMSLAVSISNIIPLTQAMCDRMLIHLETLLPEQDVQALAEQYQTGPFCPQPKLYMNHYHGTSLYQIYGVSLEEQCKFGKRKVPSFVCKCLSAIEKGMAVYDENERRLWWTNPLQLGVIHPLRHVVNQGEKVTLKQLRDYDVPTIVGALRLHLMELPECLCTFELYYPVKSIYSSMTEDRDQETRIGSLRTLLTTIPAPNFYTINVILQHLHGLCSGIPIDHAYMSELAATLGPLFLRTQAYTKVTLHDKHPQRMLKDLITYFPLAFAPMQRASLTSVHSTAQDLRSQGEWWEGGQQRRASVGRGIATGADAPPAEVEGVTTPRSGGSEKEALWKMMMASSPGVDSASLSPRPGHLTPEWEEGPIKDLTHIDLEAETVVDVKKKRRSAMSFPTLVTPVASGPALHSFSEEVEEEEEEVAGFRSVEVREKDLPTPMETPLEDFTMVVPSLPVRGTSQEATPADTQGFTSINLDTMEGADLVMESLDNGAEGHITLGEVSFGDNIPLSPGFPPGAQPMDGDLVTIMSATAPTFPISLHDDDDGNADADADAGADAYEEEDRSVSPPPVLAPSPSHFASITLTGPSRSPSRSPAPVTEAALDSEEDRYNSDSEEEQYHSEEDIPLDGEDKEEEEEDHVPTRVGGRARAMSIQEIKLMSFMDKLAATVEESEMPLTPLEDEDEDGEDASGLHTPEGGDSDIDLADSEDEVATKEDEEEEAVPTTDEVSLKEKETTAKEELLAGLAKIAPEPSTVQL